LIKYRQTSLAGVIVLVLVLQCVSLFMFVYHHCKRSMSDVDETWRLYNYVGEKLDTFENVEVTSMLRGFLCQFWGDV